MNTFHHTKPSRANKLLSAGFALSLLVGLVPVAPVAADSLAAATGTCQVPNPPSPTPPTTTPLTSVFLPLITKVTQGGALLTASANQPQAIARQLNYQVGNTYVYEWNFTIQSKTIAHDSEGTHDQGGETTVVHALADVTITDKSAEGVYSGQVILRNPFLCNTNGQEESVVNDAELVTQLQTPILFKQASNGVITSVLLPQTAKPQVTNLQKAVLNALQVTLKEGTSYTAEEQGGQGVYTATYTLQENGNNLQITRQYDQGDFSKLIAAGDPMPSLMISDTTRTTLDGAQGVITLVETTEEIATAADTEPNNAPDNRYMGATVWSKVNSVNRFVLKEVKTASLQAAALPLSAYSTGDLGAVLEESGKNRQGLDLSQINLDQEFALLEATPDDPKHISRMLDLFDADSGTVVLDKLRDRLYANAGKDAIAKRYMDVLAAIGTPAAQEILSCSLGYHCLQGADLSATLSVTVEEQALIDLVLIGSPTITTVNALQALSADAQSSLQAPAIAVLGATADNLADENPGLAESLAGGLISSLATTTDTNAVRVYLDALGNTGLPSTLSAIASYITTPVTSTVNAAGQWEESEVEAVRVAALIALRRIPGQQAEDLLVATLSNAGESNPLRFQVAQALSERPTLSLAATTALQSYQTASLASAGLHNRGWYHKLGGDKMGIEFPGGFTVASPPQYNFRLYAYQQANGLLWGRKFNLATGELKSQRLPNGQLFGAYLSVFGYRVRQYEYTVPCAATRSGTLPGYSTEVGVYIKVPVSGVVTVDFEARIGVHSELNYHLTGSVCNVIAADASATITPRVYAKARGEASVNLRLARGGAGVEATLLSTSMPVKISATYNGGFRFCSEIRVNNQAVSGRIYGFADVGIDYWWGAWWRRVFEGNLHHFSSPSYSRVLYSNCE